MLGVREEEFSDFESLDAEVIVVPGWKFVLPCTSRGNGSYEVLCELGFSRKMNEMRAPTVHSIPGLKPRQHCVSIDRLPDFRPSSAN